MVLRASPDSSFQRPVEYGERDVMEIGKRQVEPVSAAAAWSRNHANDPKQHYGKGRENDDDDEMEKALVQLRWPILDSDALMDVADVDPPLVLVTCSSSRRPQEEGTHCTNN
ncbi:uncharacterized protein B0T23DRAFT_413642 [Neurospora hispaniola]|uniref:Uncharacterized protein n=1 Tax=Neurospora hispaniola TaxID=588809 RepID=A0AAJ0I6A0_9PEZI|nr:hypothetical protein B0T23DRAFT_413642 [Neurospora hispaniola]